MYLSAKFKSDVHFYEPWPENLDNLEKQFFSDYSENQIRRQGFLDSGCGWTRSAPSALHFLPRCLQSCRPKLCFGPEKLINSTIFAAGGNYTLELISNWTTAVDFFSCDIFFSSRNTPWLLLLLKIIMMLPLLIDSYNLRSELGSPKISSFMHGLLWSLL